MASLELLRAVPDSISRLVLADWLHPSDLSNLDAAYCNVEGRMWFLAMLPHCSKEIFQVSRMKNVDDVAREPLLDWFLKRNLMVSHLAIPNYNKPNVVNHDRNLNFIQHFGPFLLSIDTVFPANTTSGAHSTIPQQTCPAWLQSSTNNLYTNIAAYCPNLLHIKISSAGHHHRNPDVQLLANCKKIQYMNLRGMKLMHEDLQAFAALHELRYFDVFSDEDG